MNLISYINHDLADFYFKHEVFPIIVQYEGKKYTDDPKDPGGPTKYGWTLRTYRRLIDKNATKFDLKDLTRSKAMTYYKVYFWDRYGASKISKKRLSITLLLAQINLGPYRPNRLLQKMTNNYCQSNLTLDGILGKKSIIAINKCKFLWPGYPYILFYFYSTNEKISPVWKWANAGLMSRIFHGVIHD